MNTLAIFRMDAITPRLVGHISLDSLTFTYDQIYLTSPDAHALSCSLPLREEAYRENSFKPFFDGLLPEGRWRQAVANELGVEPDNYLMLLFQCGLETIGDLAVTDGGLPLLESSYRPLSSQDLKRIFSNLDGLAEASTEARLSLAGSQGKTGLAHIPGEPMNAGWLQPISGAASTHILKVGSLKDIPFLEYLCLNTAAACGINVPETLLLDFGRPILCVERYDRKVLSQNEELQVSRLHQEDFAQALGVMPSAKYRELTPSSATVIAEFLRLHSTRPIENIEAFAKITLFNFLIGNCDNHLKNLSLLYGAAWKNLQLAPLYDAVCTTRFERFSRAMGMHLGHTSIIDEVSAQDINAFGNDIGLDRQELGELCGAITSCAPSAINELGQSLPHFEELPYIAWDLLEDMAPRLQILEQVAK